MSNSLLKTIKTLLLVFIHLCTIYLLICSNGFSQTGENVNKTPTFT